MRGRGPAEDTRKTFIRYITGKERTMVRKRRLWGPWGKGEKMKYAFLTSAFIPEDDRKI